MSCNNIEAIRDASAMEANLALMREGLQTPYPGYPSQAERLTIPYEKLARDTNGRVILPDGPWDVAEHPGGIDASRTVSADEQAGFAAAGYELDSAGRPLHPWFVRMLADPLLGVVINKGAMWKFGPSLTCGAVVLKARHALMVQRSDTGQWSIPGGFVDNGETTKHAMVREVHEETGLVIPSEARISRAYRGPVADIRLTAHAWPMDTSYLVELPEDGPLPEVAGADDAVEAAWMPTEELREEKIALFGSHRFLVRRALAIAGK